MSPFLPARRRTCASDTHAGFTLVELLVVVAVLAVVGAIAFPNLAPTDLARLDVAAEDVAAALRYARAESMRRGAVVSTGDRLVRFDASASTDVVSVSDYDGFTIAAPMTHPADKKPYSLDLINGTPTQGSNVTAATFTNSLGLPLGAWCIFNQDGNPYQYFKLFGAVVPVSLTSGMVEVTYAGRRRQVTLDGTGRVTVGPVL